MAGINKVILIGNLGRDPETRYTPSGVAVSTFSIATSENWTDKDTGEKREKTEWHRIVAWRRLGEIVGEYLSKGSRVYVEGKLQTRSWEDKKHADITHYTTEIIAKDIQFLSPKQGGGSGRGEQQGFGDAYDEYPGQTRGSTNRPSSLPEDDIPF